MHYGNRIFALKHGKIFAIIDHEERSTLDKKTKELYYWRHVINMEKATFAAGCFWGVEELFRQLDGVIATQVGYIGGQVPKPTYQMVCSDTTGHAEAVEITYDPNKISYEQLLEIFWNNHNPTTLNSQGPDFGTQYRSVIFYHTPAQQAAAIKSKEQLIQAKRFSKPIVTQILPASQFYRAEEYHQQYLLKQGKSYC